MAFFSQVKLQEISVGTLKGVVFDLDGVITGTAKLHEDAWKKAFDEFLKYYAETHDEAYKGQFREFTKADYLQHVDGIPRDDGIKAFLVSRKIDDIPYGDEKNEAGFNSVCAIAKYKNDLYLEGLSADTIEIFDSTVDLVKELACLGVPMAIGSSSKNARHILELTKLIEYFSVIVDGNVIKSQALPGKPDGAMFKLAAEMIGAAPEEAIVIEDALKGVEAGRHAGFRLVIGIDRGGKTNEEFKARGATVVVGDLEELPLQTILSYFSTPSLQMRA